MFESVLNNAAERQEEERQIAAEKRQVNYAQQQQYDAASTDPGDDQNYMIGQDKKSDLIRWQQELDDDMYQMVLSLQSLREDDGKIIHILDEEKKPIPSLCNKRFIYQVVVPKLRPFISKNLINSNLDESEIRKMQMFTFNDLADMMSDNWDEYGIDFVNWNGIIRDMQNVVKASVWRSLKGWTKKVDSSMIKRIESERYGTEDSEQQKGIKSLFSS